MNEEALKILKMVKEGKITADQGVELLDALKDQPASTKPESSSCCPTEKGDKPKCIGIYVTHGDEKELKVKIPYGLAKLVSKFTPKGMARVIKDDGEVIDLSSIMKKIEDCGCGEVMCVEVDDGKQVKICCE